MDIVQGQQSVKTAEDIGLVLTFTSDKLQGVLQVHLGPHQPHIRVFRMTSAQPQGALPPHSGMEPVKPNLYLQEMPPSWGRSGGWPLGFPVWPRRARFVCLVSWRVSWRMSWRCSGACQNRRQGLLGSRRGACLIWEQRQRSIQRLAGVLAGRDCAKIGAHSLHAPITQNQRPLPTRADAIPNLSETTTIAQ